MSAAVVAPTAAPMQGAHPAAPRTASLFVSDLPRDLPNLDDLLQSYFGKIGTVVTTKVCVDISTRKPLGYGYVNFQDAAKAEQAIKELNLTELTPKHEIRVAWSQRDPSQRRVNVNNLVVKKLGDSVTGRMLMDAFAPLGTVVSVKVSRTDTGKTRHYGFVQFESKEVAETALALSAEGKLLVGGDVVHKKVTPSAQKRAGDNKKTDKAGPAAEKTAGIRAAGIMKKKKKNKAEKRKDKHEKLVLKLQAAAELTKKKEKEEKQTAQVGTLGMSSLSQLLESLMEKEQAVHASTKNKKVDTKMKQQMASTELEQFKNVLAHPAFQNDPMGIIKEHLKNKIAAVNSEREAKLQARRRKNE